MTSDEAIGEGSFACAVQQSHIGGHIMVSRSSFTGFITALHLFYPKREYYMQKSKQQRQKKGSIRRLNVSISLLSLCREALASFCLVPTPLSPKMTTLASKSSLTSSIVEWRRERRVTPVRSAGNGVMSLNRSELRHQPFKEVLFLSLQGYICNRESFKLNTNRFKDI